MSANPEGRAATDPEIPDILPLLPIRDLVVFPYMIVPLRVTRPVSMEAVAKALEAEERLCFLVAQRDSTDEEPAASSFYRSGTIGMIMRMRKLSEGGLKILVQGLCRAKIQKFVSDSPCYRVRIDRNEDAPPARTLGSEALLRSVRGNVDKLTGLGKSMQPELGMVVGSVEDPGRMADLVASNLTLKVNEAQELLELDNPIERLTRVNQNLEKEIGILEVQSQIQNRAKEEMSKTQRDYYLREQLRQIRNELGDGDVHGEEMEELRAKVQKAGLSPEAKAEADKQIRRLDQMHAESAEASVLRTYIDWLTELPWTTSSEDTLDIDVARKILDEDHYDLEHIKDRILDYLAVRKLRGGVHGPILCFLGPPGVGKTSLGRSIARAVGRKFVRISLGGVRDEAEIRGHRRTYVGALPGRLIQGMKQAGTNNPVMLLDEVDKLGSDVRGDPSAALLEVLDPEQNHNFRDHYLGVPFDLSRVLFIATANLPESIPPPLRDRMETLRLSGYSEEEKLAIAERFLVPKQIAEAGLTSKEIVIGRPVLRKIISEYTREAGLRELERLVAQLARKVARRVVEEGVKPRASGRGKAVGRRSDDQHRGDHEASGPAALPGRGTARRRRGRHGQRARLDAVRRRGAARRGADHGGQGLAHADRPARRRDEGVGDGGAVVRARARAGARAARRVLRRPRDPHPRALGRGAQGRAVGGRDHGVRAGVADLADAGAARPGHDRRADVARQGAADRRPEGKAARGGARRDDQGAHSGGQRPRAVGNPGTRARATDDHAGAHDGRGPGSRAGDELVVDESAGIGQGSREDAA